MPSIIVRVFLSVAIILSAIIFFYKGSPSAHLSFSSRLRPTQNSTFGFGAVLLISLPERTDRRDGITLLTSFSGVKITHTVDGVLGSSISAKARPYGKARDDVDDAHFGSWRSHMNALKYIVDNDIETALILEDDVDWDVAIKSQLQSLSDALHNSDMGKSWTEDEMQRYPFGRNWDILHLGASRALLPQEPYLTAAKVYQDSSPAATLKGDCDPATAFFCFKPVLDGVNAPQGSRVFMPSHGALGLASIAVTRRGAQRLLYLLSWRGLDTGLDWSIRDELDKGTLKGWTVLPPLFGSWVPGGGGSGDSDINKGAEGVDLQAKGGNLKGISRGTADSVRTRLGELLEGESQWDVLAKSLESRQDEDRSAAKDYAVKR